MEYSLHSRDYLKRARKRLNENTQESLFYAAFELRCGIQSRLTQYEDAMLGITKSKSAGWEIPKLAKNVERIYRTGDKMIRVDFQDEEGTNVGRSMFYTPVNSNLRRMAGKLGNLLHCPKEFRESDDAWWVEIRAFLEDVFIELEKANKGNVLCIPIWGAGKRSAHIVTEPTIEETVDQQVASIGEIGERLLVSFHHCDDFPDDL